MRSLPYTIDSPSPYQGEGDKGDRVTNKYLKGGGRYSGKYSYLPYLPTMTII